MKLAAIHHVAIIVSDYEKARDFYVNKLGFAVVRENFRKERNDWKLDLRVGDGVNAIELEIFAEPTPPKRVNRPEACGCGIWRSGWRMWKLPWQNLHRWGLNVNRFDWTATPKRK